MAERRIALPLVDRNGMKTALVRELVDALQQMNPDAPVITEGCDCLGDAASVHVDHDGFVVIARGSPHGT